MQRERIRVVIDLLQETKEELGKGSSQSARFLFDEAVRIAKDRETTAQLTVEQKQQLYHWLGSCHDALTQLEQQETPRGVPMTLKIGWEPHQIAS